MDFNPNSPFINKNNEVPFLRFVYKVFPSQRANILEGLSLVGRASSGEVIGSWSLQPVTYWWVHILMGDVGRWALIGGNRSLETWKLKNIISMSSSYMFPGHHEVSSLSTHSSHCDILVSLQAQSNVFKLLYTETFETKC